AGMDGVVRRRIRRPVAGMNSPRLLPRQRSCSAFLLAWLLVTCPHLAGATCNAIPGVSTTFRSAAGSADRPFVRPGGALAITLADACSDSGPGFCPGASRPDDAASQFAATVVFVPPSGGPRTIVVLAAQCSPLEAERQRCAAQPGAAAASCVDSPP